ncbi:MAG: riboflavin synthase [Chthoniobacteraceae bacterium]|jgi:riboflavin synthase
MFTGLVEATGAVVALHPREGASRLIVRAPAISAGSSQGDSIAVNGCCLTVAVPPAAGLLEFDLLDETLRLTNLGSSQSLVNLERALPATGRLGGHFVQGHVDCASPILDWRPVGSDYRLEIKLPPDFSQYIVAKGSIAVDGISLTVAEVTPENFTVWIIPHTRGQTNLSQARPGQLVNLEFDLLAKYVEKICLIQTSKAAIENPAN